jgi:hypothetical protein
VQTEQACQHSENEYRRAAGNEQETAGRSNGNDGYMGMAGTTMAVWRDEHPGQSRVHQHEQDGTGDDWRQNTVGEQKSRTRLGPAFPGQSPEGGITDRR